MINRYVTEELVLEPSVVEALGDIAAEHNSIIDQVVNDLIVNYISESTPLAECYVTLKNAKNPDAFQVFFEKYRTITCDGKPLARIVPLQE